VFEMDLSTVEIAEMTSMSKESAAKIMKEFGQEGIIQTDDKLLKVGSISMLEQISKRG